MGKHSEWRKLAKKARRKRKRQIKAKERDKIIENEQSSPCYQQWLRDQEQAEQFQQEEESRQHAIREAEWYRVEAEAQKQWQLLQIKLELAREERAKQNAKIRQEWEVEQQRLRDIQQQKEHDLEQKRIEHEKRLKQINNFVENGGDTPEYLKQNFETNPNKPICPFFQKTSACRFSDVCSRNHIRPGVSRTILIPNFYSHYSLDVRENEHGSDSTLEFEKSETDKAFHEFFYDVIPEMEKFGRIRIFKVCCNHVVHLRGNVYVEYDSPRSALRSYQKFNGRWYGGKQLSVEFCNIESWKSAVCGLFFVNRCPKGNSCNFLHVFRNPGNLYTISENKTPNSVTSSFSDRRNWRWSESPEHQTVCDDWESKESERNSTKYNESRKRTRRRRSRSRGRESRKKRKRSKSRRKRSKSKSNSRHS